MVTCVGQLSQFLRCFITVQNVKSVFQDIFLFHFVDGVGETAGFIRTTPLRGENGKKMMRQAIVLVLSLGD